MPFLGGVSLLFCIYTAVHCTLSHHCMPVGSTFFRSSVFSFLCQLAGGFILAFALSKPTVVICKSCGLSINITVQICPMPLFLWFTTVVHFIVKLCTQISYIISEMKSKYLYLKLYISHINRVYEVCEVQRCRQQQGVLWIWFMYCV